MAGREVHKTDLDKRVDLIVQELREIRSSQLNFHTKFNELYQAISGNDLGNMGIAKRMEELEQFKIEMEKFKIKMILIGVKTASIWAILVEIMFKYFFKL